MKSQSRMSFSLVCDHLAQSVVSLAEPPAVAMAALTLWPASCLELLNCYWTAIFGGLCC